MTALVGSSGRVMAGWLSALAAGEFTESADANSYHGGRNVVWS
jgi:hypothetical protein